MIIMGCTKDGGNAENMASGSGKGGSMARFTIANGHLYVAENYSVKVYSLSNASAPKYIKSVHIEDNTILETIFPFKNNLFVGSTDGMYIYDITQPENPTLSGKALHLRSCDPVVANDSVSYVTLRGGTNCGTADPGLYVYDVKNLSQPVQKNYLQIENPYGLSLNDTVLYVCNADKGLKVYNVKNAYAPVLKTTILNDHFTDAISYNNTLITWVKTGIAVFDISAPESPVKLGFIAN